MASRNGSPSFGPQEVRLPVEDHPQVFDKQPTDVRPQFLGGPADQTTPGGTLGLQSASGAWPQQIGLRLHKVDEEDDKRSHPPRDRVAAKPLTREQTSCGQVEQYDRRDAVNDEFPVKKGEARKQTERCGTVSQQPQNEHIEKRLDVRALSFNQVR